MNPAPPHEQPAELQRYARAAGAAYFAIIVSSFVMMGLVDSRLVVENDTAATLRNLAAQPGLYRLGLMAELLMYAAVAFLAWALYVVLRSVDERWALLALVWRLAEAVIGAVVVLAGVFVVTLAGAPLHDPGLVALAKAVLRTRAAGLDVVIVFLCLGTLVNCALLSRSRYVPRPLSALGLVSFVLMLVGSLANLLLREPHGFTAAVYAPGVVFEVAIGAWLMVRGVSTRFRTRR